MNLIRTSNSHSFNNQLIMNKQQTEIYIKNNVLFKDSFFEHPLCKAKTNDNLVKFNQASFLKKSFVYVITETVAEYPYPYFSEKIWKAVLFKQPFMLVGAKHSLKKLRELGFKTFELFWNEDYDNLDYAADRIDLIVSNLKILSSKNKKEIENMYCDMESILDFNQKYIKIFYKKQLDKFENYINLI